MPGCARRRLERVTGVGPRLVETGVVPRVEGESAQRDEWRGVQSPSCFFLSMEEADVVQTADVVFRNSPPVPVLFEVVFNVYKNG